MCYKSPGPRCSYHAKKKLNASTKTLNDVGISKGMEVYSQLKEAVDKDELEYYSTLAGMSELELSIERGEDHDGTIAAKLDYCKANRAAMLAAIKAQDQGDTGIHEDFKVPKLGESEFLKDNKIRKPWKNRRILGSKLDKSYDLNGDHVAKGLNSKEMASLQWYSGDGFIHINSQLHQEHGTYVDNMHPMERKSLAHYEKSKIDEAIKNIDTAFEKNRLKGPVVTYRGLNDHNFPQEVTTNGSYISHIEDTYKPGSTHTFPGYLSTSPDPATARGFAGSKVVMEIKTRSAIPTGFISAWNSEKEILIQRDRKFKVIAVKKDIAYESQHNKNVGMVTVIQLEELDD
jgi:hypothetical protein